MLSGPARTFNGLDIAFSLYLSVNIAFKQEALLAMSVTVSVHLSLTF